MARFSRLSSPEICSAGGEGGGEEEQCSQTGGGVNSRRGRGGGSTRWRWGGEVEGISIGHAMQRQSATVGSRRKIREGISVISSRRVMVQARFKAGAKNVSAWQPPPSHHPHTDTPSALPRPVPAPHPRHEIEVKRQSRLSPLLLPSVKTTAGSLRTIFI